MDKDDYKALEHAMLDRQYMYKHDGAQPSEVYVWGTNSNYTLGTGAQQQRNTPELLGSFSRTNTCVKQVSISEHSIKLTEKKPSEAYRAQTPNYTLSTVILIISNRTGITFS